MSSLKWLHDKLARTYPTIPRRPCSAPTGSGAKGFRRERPHAGNVHAIVDIFGYYA